MTPLRSQITERVREIENTFFLRLPLFFDLFFPFSFFLSLHSLLVCFFVFTGPIPAIVKDGRCLHCCWSTKETVRAVAAAAWVETGSPTVYCFHQNQEGPRLVILSSPSSSKEDHHSVSLLSLMGRRWVIVVVVGQRRERQMARRASRRSHHHHHQLCFEH